MKLNLTYILIGAAVAIPFVNKDDNTAKKHTRYVVGVVKDISHDMSQYEYELPYHLREPMKTETVKKLVIPKDDFECLARNIYYEAGVESHKGKIAVAQITKNRIGMRKHWNSICDVVYAKAQFSWTLDAKKKYTKPKGQLWEASVKAAHDFMNGHRIANLKGSDHYHTDYIKQPKWAKKMQVVAKIGQHIFYSGA